MKKTNKKGFTIVELVIVIAVIAILAAVLIPTFISLTKKANQSADIQAVRNMNTALIADSAAGNVTSLQDVLSILKAAGLDGNGYKALTDGYEIVWDSNLNRILYITGKTAEYPEENKKEYEEQYVRNNWVRLTGARWSDTSCYANGTAVNGSEYEANGIKLSVDSNVKIYKVETAAQLAALPEVISNDTDKGAKMIIELEPNKEYDLLGAEWSCIPEFRGIFNGNGATIKNLAITDKTLEFNKALPSWTNNNYRPYAFISYFTGQYFGNVTFDNVHIDSPGKLESQNHTVAGALGYVGAMKSDATVYIDSVTMNGSIRAPFRAAGIVGFVGGKGNNDRMNGTVRIQYCTNNAKVESYLCLSSYNTAAGIVSTTNQMTKDGKLIIEDCTNNGAISGSDVAGILANCFGAYEIDRMNSDGTYYPCGEVTINKCKNNGTITAKHSCNDQGVGINGVAHVNCALAAEIVAPYNAGQERLYVLGCTYGGTVTATGSDEQHYDDNNTNKNKPLNPDVKCGHYAFENAGFYKTTKN